MENICKICRKRIEVNRVFFEEEKECEECFRSEFIKLAKKVEELYHDKIKNKNFTKKDIDYNIDL